MNEFRALKEKVWRANLDLVEAGLVQLTWGNVSGVDRNAGVMAIKPSGVAYDVLRIEDIAVVLLESGEVVSQGLDPSSDTPTHLHLYRKFASIGGIAHSHSVNAVSWAQAGRDLPCYGTTHADYFYGAIPVTRRMRADEIRDAYEHHTGAVIIERFEVGGLDPLQIPAVLVAGHGPFTWGRTPADAVETALVLETVARMALHTLEIDASARPIDRELIDKHFLRKHGPDAYYGQRSPGDTDAP